MAEPLFITPAMVRAAAEAIEDECLTRLGRDLGTIHRDDIVRAGLEAAARVALDILHTPESSDAVLAAVLCSDGAHRYVSTYCVHGDCQACRRTCKTCHAPCLHDCHQEAGR